MKIRTTLNNVYFRLSYKVVVTSGSDLQSKNNETYNYRTGYLTNSTPSSYRVNTIKIKIKSSLEMCG